MTKEKSDLDHPHFSVMLKEFLSFFADKKIRVFFEGTLGAGGHAEALLSSHPEIELYIACDKDPQAIDIAKKRLSCWREKLHIYQGDFVQLERYLERSRVDSIDGAFFDFGVSSMQIDQPEKGFSFMKEGPLDMRMDPSQPLTAQKLINEASEQQLSDWFFLYGEEKKSRQIAKAIVEERRKYMIKTTTQLSDLILKVFNNKRGKLHPATLVFQALRIVVNQELSSIKEALLKSLNFLSKGQRVGAISFHSLEDRIVKNVFKEACYLSKEDKRQGRGVLAHLVTKKPLEADWAELRLNPRSRSAKMRFAEKN
ncbi:MAG: 16S rRNA (cytosine(1402)-N(4))-methyltransferase RsmH [Rhabdochlamydiaceae bacterium]